MLFDRRDPNLLRQKLCEGAKTDSRAKFDKETVAEAHNYGAQDPQALLRLCSGLLRLAQALLRLAQALLSLAQALLWHAHPRLR